MIETYLLEQFVAFSDCGTLIAAAELLHITQPSLSRSMKKLEDELGVPIFVRENNRLTLNETGWIAVDYARRALQANQALTEQVRAFDRGLHTVSLGSCAPWPVNALLPTLQDHLYGMTLSTELADDPILIGGLKSRRYQLAVLHSQPDDKALLLQTWRSEQLYISISASHPLAKQPSVTFAELKGLRILVSAAVGFWMDVVKTHLDPADLLVQANPDAMSELVEASTLPLFNSDQMLRQGYHSPGRVSIPISDEPARVTYILACLASEKSRYSSLFSALRADALRR